MKRFIHALIGIFKRIIVVVVPMSISHVTLSQSNPPPITGPIQIDCAPANGTYVYYGNPNNYPVAYAWFLLDGYGNYLTGPGTFQSPFNQQNPINLPTFTATFTSNGAYRLKLIAGAPFGDNDIVESDYDDILINVGIVNTNKLTSDYISGTNQTIRASQQITSSAYTFVHAGATVVAKAGNSIILSPTFTAQAGSVFTALISSNSCQNRLDMADVSQLDPELENKQGMIQSGLNDAISLFPNPSNGAFAISLANGIAFGNLTVYNSVGESVYAGQEIMLFKAAYSIDLTNLPSGIYSAEFKTTEKKAWRKKLIIRK